MGLEYPVDLKSIETYVRQQHGSDRFIALNEIDVISDWAGQIVNEIEREWPVDTSTSRDSFSYIVNNTGYGFTILNDCDYVEFIHRAGEPPIPPLWETLIPDVIDQYAQGLLQAMRDAVDETEARFTAADRAAEAATRARAASRAGRR